MSLSAKADLRADTRRIPGVKTASKLQLAWLFLVASASVAGTAQAPRRSAAPLAPPLPATWVNGPALSNAALAGKAVFLIFFEET